MTAFRSFPKGALFPVVLPVTLGLVGCAGGPSADAPVSRVTAELPASTEAVLARLAAQEERLAAQAAELERQRRDLEDQRRALSDLVLAAQTGRGLTVPPRADVRPPHTPSVAASQVAQASAPASDARGRATKDQRLPAHNPRVPCARWIWRSYAIKAVS